MQFQSKLDLARI